MYIYNPPHPIQPELHSSKRYAAKLQALIAGAVSRICPAARVPWHRGMPSCTCINCIVYT